MDCVSVCVCMHTCHVCVGVGACGRVSGANIEERKER